MHWSVRSSVVISCTKLTRASIDYQSEFIILYSLCCSAYQVPLEQKKILIKFTLLLQGCINTVSEIQCSSYFHIAIEFSFTSAILTSGHAWWLTKLKLLGLCMYGLMFWGTHADSLRSEVSQQMVTAEARPRVKQFYVHTYVMLKTPVQHIPKCVDS